MTNPNADSLAKASPNFGFLVGQDVRLLQAATAAERHVFEDPISALMRLRQFGELLAQEAAAHVGIYKGPLESQVDLLRRMSDRGVLTREVVSLFHDVRKKGNEAAHDGRGTRSEALHQLRMARTLAIWFHRTVGKQPNLRYGPFVPPPDPAEEDAQLRAELGRLRGEMKKALGAVEELKGAAKAEADRRQAAELARAKAYEDLEAALDLAQESEELRASSEKEWATRMQALQKEAEAAGTEQTRVLVQRAQEAGDTEHLDLDEAATRKLIDAQLQEAGWEADTQALCHKNGVRPTKGQNLAIAEWPTSSGPADYVLFAGLTAIAVVEAKRKRKDVAGAIEQAKRYSRDYVIQGQEELAGGPWGDYQVPFLFSTNGRPFLRQIQTKSGIWFLDARRSTNHPSAMEGWYTPEGLNALLRQNHEEAEKKLKTEPTDYLGLRDYQVEAIQHVEQGIHEGKRDMLLAMATGTGKTRTALGLIYRLLKAKRFRRVLFLVDRSSLGEQAQDAFKNVKLENLQSLYEIYDVKELEDLVPDKDTRLHVATVQGMVKRLLYPSDEDETIPVDRYDCIIVDESHRGYNLDREMSEGELQFRSQADYVSKYRRVLDHFDAVRVGLTATPALHTTEIFGKPIYQYSYRQAVIDGYLVDHEPPIRLITALNQAGIHWAVGEEVAVYDKLSGQLDLYEAPDEIDIEVSGFNTKVVTENFNRVVCRKLAEEIDPTLPGKTLIFCATDSHADLVVDLLKEAFTEVYGEVEDDAVQKITGAADKPSQKIRLFKNEALPNVGVTVDLLTTGIDVPEIVNLVFIRRVKSRILYEQMLGRATRLCPEIGKEFFKIYDAVDLYAALEDYSTMKPVVTRPLLSFTQLIEELVGIEDEEHGQAIVEDILVKFHRRKSLLKGETLTSFETLTHQDAEEFTEMLKGKDLGELRGWFSERPGLPSFLDRLKGESSGHVLISEHEDELLGTEHGYGEGVRPEDYLVGFGEYLDQSGNDLPALKVVMQRPRDLTRQQLRELRLALDDAGYTESQLRAAWKDTSNQDIAASIIGFIRAQALGSPLIPYADRIDRALQKILASQAWTGPQRRWLERIGSQLQQEIIVDKEALDRGQFQAQGGFRRLNKVFGGKLEEVLGDLHEELWNDAG